MSGDLEALALVPEGVVVLDAVGAIVHATPRAVSLLSLPDDAEGQPLSKVVDLVDDTGALCTDELMGCERDVDRMAERTLKVRLAGERHRAVSVAGSYLDDGRTILTFRHAGRRERNDAARSDVVATVSHEIRSPLTSVKGFTRTLLAKWDRFNDEQKRTMLETINADADRVTRLLTELLDVSRIDAGRVQLRRQLVDVGALAADVVEKAGHRPYGTDRDIVVDVQSATSHVIGDPDKLEQVITNLVENALHYAPESQVRVIVMANETHVEIAVADDGPGIAADQARRIFEKFGRGRDVRRAGTGLGLFITRGLARAHGGEVHLESEVGEGATFTVRLPKPRTDED